MDTTSAPDLLPAPTDDAWAFLQWLADCVHIMACPDCLRDHLPLPAISLSALPFLRQHLYTPCYQQFLQRLGAILPPPADINRELDVAEYLMQERARTQADRHSRFLQYVSAQTLTSHPPTPPTPADPAA